MFYVLFFLPSSRLAILEGAEPNAWLIADPDDPTEVTAIVTDWQRFHRPNSCPSWAPF